MKIGIATCIDKPNLTVGDREFASFLKEKGFHPEPLIWNDPHVLKKDWDAIILRSTWDYHQNLDQFLNWLSDVEQLSIQLINSFEVIRWNCQKSYLLEMEKKGLSIVPSLIIERELSESFVLEQIDKTGWKNLVLKPTVSATAFLTYHMSSSSPDLTDVIHRIKKHSDIIVQPFVSSVPIRGEVSFIFFKDECIHFSHAVLKQPMKGDFRVQSDYGGIVEAFQP